MSAGRYVRKPLDVRASNATGNPARVSDLTSLTVQVFGTFTATVELEVSLDGTNFVAPTSMSFTAAGVKSLGGIVASHVRVKTSGYSAGTPDACVAGIERAD